MESRPEEVEGLDDEEREKVEARNKGNQALLDAIAETTAPDGQVVLDACLTNAADPDAVASHDQDPDKLAAARKGMAKTLAQDVLGDADGQRVLASQAATGGTDMVRRGGRMQLDVKGHHFEGAGHDALVAWLKAKPRRVVALSKVRTDDVLAVGLPTSEADLDACTDAMASITEIPTSLAQAREWGVAYRALRPLVEARGNDVLDTYVFLEVVRRKAADKIMHYYRTCAPGIDGGHHDVMSMLAMIAEGVDYAGIRAALPLSLIHI